ncbi:MAG: PIG-L family deacetylase [Anaerolineales bacterium]|jgi:LmbE family N-acetylglucosaminyl deacetylase
MGQRSGPQPADLLTHSRQRLLSVLAHPDDESFGMGGTLALYAQRGVEVHLICATRGEAGMMDPEHLQGYASVAEKREAELRCAARILGLREVHFLDYRDSGMPGSTDNQHPQALAAAPLDQVAAQIARIIRQVKPQVVLTFDPIGGYRHPDHIAIHKATLLAYEAAGDPTVDLDDLPPYTPEKLYYHTISRRFLRVAVRLMPLFGKDPTRWGKNGDIDLKSLAIEDFPTHAVVDFTPVRELKAEASACHLSQGGAGLAQGIWGWIMRFAGSKEIFMRAYPAPANGVVEKDLFTGIAEEQR